MNEEKNEKGQVQNLVILPAVAVEDLKNELRELKALIIDKAQNEIQNQWLESEDARKLLGVSQKTWQTYRDSRAIPFSQFGRKIYVKRSEIEAFLQSHTIKN